MRKLLKRIGAFLVDCAILFFVLTITNLFIPKFVEVETLSDRTFEITQKYVDQEITEEKFIEETNNINYELSRGTYLSTISSIVIYILYFVVFQAYNRGQTLGKKLFRLQVLKTNGELPDINSLTGRCLIPYGILVNFISVILILFASKDIYLSVDGILGYVHIFVIFISIILMFINGRGIQDYLANTKVEEI